MVGPLLGWSLIIAQDSNVDREFCRRGGNLGGAAVETAPGLAAVLVGRPKVLGPWTTGDHQELLTKLARKQPGQLWWKFEP